MFLIWYFLSFHIVIFIFDNSLSYKDISILKIKKYWSFNVSVLEKPQFSRVCAMDKWNMFCFAIRWCFSIYIFWWNVKKEKNWVFNAFRFIFTQIFRTLYVIDFPYQYQQTQKHSTVKSRKKMTSYFMFFRVYLMNKRMEFF